MLKNKIYISSLGNSVEIDSNSIGLDKLLTDIKASELLYRFIPNVNFEKSDKVVRLFVESKQNTKIVFSLESSLIQGKYPVDYSSTDVIVVAEYLLERMRQEKGDCIIHSSSIYDENGGIMFFGNPTGAGKTSITLFMTSKYKYHIFSDEKTLINLKTQEMSGQIGKIYLENKTRDLLAKEGLNIPTIIKIPKTKNHKLKILIVPAIASESLNTICVKYTEDQLKWFLYEEFSKDIRLLNGLIMNFSRWIIFIVVYEKLKFIL